MVTMKTTLQIAISLTIATILYNCTEKTYLINEIPSNNINTIEYFGDIHTISYPEIMDENKNENCIILIRRIKELKSYMGNNKERLDIQDWHHFEDVKPIIDSDTINASNSLYSYDGNDYRQISEYNNREYFWKTMNYWFSLYGISDTVVQNSNKSKGYHGFRKSFLDRIYDNINWYKTTDSLVIKIVRTGGYGRDDVSIWINKNTSSGKLEFKGGEGHPQNIVDIYSWSSDGSGTYHQNDINTGVISFISSW